MATFTLSMDCNNAAFEGETLMEIARILRAAARTLEDYPRPDERIGVCQDINGNVVGRYKFDPA